MVSFLQKFDEILRSEWGAGLWGRDPQEGSGWRGKKGKESLGREGLKEGAQVRKKMGPAGKESEGTESAIGPPGRERGRLVPD